MKVHLGVITIFPIGKEKGHGSLDYTSYTAIVIGLIVYTLIVRLYEKPSYFFFKYIINLKSNILGISKFLNTNIHLTFPI
jgi:hypothetical protein